MPLILKHLKNYKTLIFANIIGSLSFALVELGIPTIMSSIIDKGIATKNIPYIKMMIMVMIIVAVVGGCGSILIGYCSSKVSMGVAKDIRNEIFKKSQKFSHTEYNKFGVSSMIVRTTNDVQQLQIFVNTILRTALLTPVMFLVSITMTFLMSSDLSLVIIATLPFIIMGVYIIAKFSGSISDKQQKSLDKINRILRENLTGIRVIRAFRKDEFESKRFDEANSYYSRMSQILFKVMSATNPAFILVLNAAVLAVFWISSNKINMGTLQVGQLVAFLEYLFHAMFSIMLFSMVFVMYPKAAVSAQRIEEVLKETPIIENPENGVKETDINGLVEFDHVTFAYPDGENAVLEDISFTANAGETVAFIGSTGSGKSSLINLIPRFYDVTSGSIRVDGVDVRDYDLPTLRAKIGFTPQKARLFSGSIRMNLQFGRDDATEEEIKHFAKVAQAYEFIKKKSKQFDDELSEGGANVSGGQKQRLSIARALVRKAEIYVFDDSFSALDLKTDAKLRARLKEETKDSVVLIVAQRISSIMDAGKIIVLDEGRAVSIGTHEELLRTSKIYREIAVSQLGKEVVGDVE
ncbi:MAG: ABC transporter ATP-binding protein/permease [Clostridioides sp.]|jgi:ATP-binding cassette subfamily B multidrug efflux pump|nr:ABC transporter ATP-binding protein/permease [Clostridioides sp.]